MQNQFWKCNTSFLMPWVRNLAKLDQMIQQCKIQGESSMRGISAASLAALFCCPLGCASDEKYRAFYALGNLSGPPCWGARQERSVLKDGSMERRIILWAGIKQNAPVSGLECPCTSCCSQAVFHQFHGISLG